MWAFLQILAGWYVADLITGIVHMMFDRFSWTGTLHREFTDHHLRPDEILTRSTWQLMRKPLVAIIPLLPVIYELPWFGVPLIVGLILSVKAHAWSHKTRNNPVVEFLQASGVLLAPWDHAAHHRSGHLRGYASLNGWSNLLLDTILDLVEGRAVA